MAGMGVDLKSFDGTGGDCGSLTNGMLQQLI